MDGENTLHLVESALVKIVISLLFGEGKAVMGG